MKSRTICSILLVSAVSVVGWTVQARGAECEVWSRAENRCLQQAPSAPSGALPNATEAADRIATIEKEIARLRTENEMLRTTSVARPSVTDTTTADRLETAVAAFQQSQLDAANRRAQQEQNERLENASWYVKDATFGTTEVNSVFIRYGWAVTVKNGISRAQTFDLAVQFLDKNGLVIDTSHVYGRGIAAQDEQTIRGDALIRLPAALNVASVQAVATRKAK
jgi:hypothetical protein